MVYAVICIVSLLVATLTLFSGFGLGTLLLPAFSFFFPIGIAVAATAVVHLANNLFKLFVVGKMANISATLRFAIPGLFTSALGAWLLVRLGDVAPLAEYNFLGRTYQIEAVKLLMGLLIGGFSLLELIPGLSHLSIDAKYLSLGGALSGFFGGLSGMQGALRSMFLIRAGLSKEEFIGTTVVSAVIVDCSRIAVYGSALLSGQLAQLWEAGLAGLVGAGIVAAALGTIVGSKLVHKVTMATIQRVVGVFLIIVAIGLSLGLI